MAARKPISLVKGENNAAETWPDEPVRLLEDHVDPFLLWCISKGSSDVSI
jgi:defect-in-organelle-trafficking protein DotB